MPISRYMTIEERFKAQVKVNPETLCWEWLGSKDKDGYGYIKHHNKTTKAHRTAYELHKGDLIPNMCVLHTCDNPSCVNPDHLYLGTHLDNSNDRKNRGRDSGWKGLDMRGERNHNSKLTQEEVSYIRCVYKWGMGPQLAKQFGVIPIMIHRIIRGEAWKTHE